MISISRDTLPWTPRFESHGREKMVCMGPKWAFDVIATYCILTSFSDVRGGENQYILLYLFWEAFTRAEVNSQRISSGKAWNKANVRPKVLLTLIPSKYTQNIPDECFVTPISSIEQNILLAWLEKLLIKQFSLHCRNILYSDAVYWPRNWLMLLRECLDISIFMSHQFSIIKK